MKIENCDGDDDDDDRKLFFPKITGIASIVLNVRKRTVSSNSF